MDHNSEVKKFSLEEVLAACSIDSSFRKSFMANPREILDSLNIDYAPGYNLQVIEVPKKTMVISILPLVEFTQQV